MMMRNMHWAVALIVATAATISQAATISPADITGLALWLKADAGTFTDFAGTTAATDGDTVFLWKDQETTTGSNDAFAPNDGAGTAILADATPTWVDNQVNGLPVVRFDGEDASNDRLYLQDTPLSTNPDQWTIFVVFKQALDDTSQDMLFTHRNGGTQLIQTSVAGSSATLQLRGSGNHLVTLTQSGVVNGAFNVAMFQFDTVNDSHAISVNGATETTNTYDFGAENFIADTQRIGYYFSGSSNGFLNGDIAELIVYQDVALTPDQKNDIGYYLAQKYDLTTEYTGPSVTVPEPTTAALLGAGLLLVRRRRRA